MRVHRSGRAALLLLPLLSPVARAAPASAADWPQLWGPAVSGAVDEGPAAGGGSLRELWRRPIGSAFSAVVVKGERGYTGESDGTTDHVIAFDVRSGGTLWRAPLGETYRGHNGSRDGPVATPAVDGSRVFMAGPRGVLVALDAASGRELWRKDLLADPQTKAPFYGFGASPIVAQGKVVLQVGGAETSGLLAFDAATGALAWTARPAATKGDSGGYTMAVPWGDRSEPHVVVTGHDRVFAVRVSDGGVAWSHALAESEEPTRAPLVIDDARLLVSRGRDSSLLKLTRDGAAWAAAETWKSPRLKGGLSPTVHADGALYGFSGQYLVCLDAATGEPRWREKTNSGTLIRVGRTLVVLGEQSGVIRLAAAEPASYRELARAAAFNPGALSSTGPSYADGRVFVRNVEEMVAYALDGGSSAGGQP